MREFSLARCSPLANYLALTALICAAASPGAKATCLTGNLSDYGNNCTTFESSSPSIVTIMFTDAKLNNSTNPPRNGARYFQLYPFLAGGTGSYTITDFAWSRDNSSFTSFQSGGLTLSPSANPTAIIDTGSVLGSPFYIRYQLPAGMTGEIVVDLMFRANNDGSTTTLSNSGNPYNGSQVLDTTALKSGVGLGRDNTLVPTPPVPAPVPLLGTALAMAHASRLRRRIRTQQSTKLNQGKQAR